MAIWLMRAGKHGEFETKFIQEKRVYATWDNLDVDLAKLTERKQLFEALVKRYPTEKPKTITAWVSQVWPFAHEMKQSDLVVLPLKLTQRAIQIGEITDDYHFEASGPSPYFHWRAVKWIGEALPRSNFGNDLLNTFGSQLTICRVKANNAESRIAAMRADGWKPEKIAAITKTDTSTTDDLDNSDGDELENKATDRIARLILARFKGHGLTRLVEAILIAQGYTTYRSPEGSDGGADILAGYGPLGFGAPRLCVQVKSENSAIDRPTVDNLLGAVSKFGADEGLFVSWSNFKPNVQKELASSFFEVRLWGQKELLEALFAHYDQFDDDLNPHFPDEPRWFGMQFAPEP